MRPGPIILNIFKITLVDKIRRCLYRLATPASSYGLAINEIKEYWNNNLIVKYIRANSLHECSPNTSLSYIEKNQLTYGIAKQKGDDKIRRR